MFFKCTSCQAEHEPPQLPASNVLTHCPKCGATVTMIPHDTEPPPPGARELSDPVVPVLPPEPALEGMVFGVAATASIVRTSCRSCGGPYNYGEDGTLLSIDHAPECDRIPASDTEPEFAAADVVDSDDDTDTDHQVVE